MTRLLLTTAFSLMLGLVPALAQDGPRGMMGMMGGGCPTVGMMGQGMMGGWSRGDGWGRGMMGRQPRMEALVDGRLAYLKGELAITAEQTAAWDAYAAAVSDRVGMMQGMHQGMVDTLEDGSAVERMDARISAMEAMLDSMKALKPATEALYAVLDDEQKKVADDLIGADCGAF